MHVADIPCLHIGRHILNRHAGVILPYIPYRILKCDWFIPNFSWQNPYHLVI